MKDDANSGRVDVLHAGGQETSASVGALENTDPIHPPLSAELN